jgi:methylated-DNA-[protein]-cysteine S-methyltransferase
MTVEMWSTTTPIGPWTVIAEAGAVVASGFSEPGELAARLPVGSGPARTASDLGPISSAVEEYLQGDVAALDQVPVRQPGGEFSQHAWQVMREIPPASTWSYAELATKAGNPAAVRAAASACARNLVAPFVPCHRVVRSDGTMGGYYYGLPVKSWLLAHEERSVAGRRPNSGGS